MESSSAGRALPRSDSDALPVDERSTGGAVSTSHYLATDAGAQALELGGNAIDAAIAAAAVLCVVYPDNVALGGDLVALVRDPGGRISFVNATGRAPADQTLEALRSVHGDALPARGIDTVTVPGGVGGWLALHELGGRLPIGDLLARAEELAVESPLSRSTADALVTHTDALRADPGCSALFFPHGTALRRGQPLRQPALARTIGTLRSRGPEDFYRGEVARRWVGGLRELGSRITLEDASSYTPTVGAPLSRRVFGVDVHTGGPNTQGFALLRNALAAERGGWSWPLTHDARQLAHAFHASNAVRGAFLADPDVALHDSDALVSMTPPAAAPAATGPASGDTVGLVAVSDDGWAVSLVQSMFWAFGACVLEQSTGILFHNRGTSFRLDASRPAAFGGGRRPPHTLMPVLVERDGELAYAVATMGGQAQAQIHTHLLLNALGGASAVAATSAPRWVIGAQESGDSDTTATIEHDVDPAVAVDLAAAGFDVKIVPPRDELLGHSNLIRVLASGYDAASDPRSDGSARVVARAPAPPSTPGMPPVEAS